MTKFSYPDKLPSSVGSQKIHAVGHSRHSPYHSQGIFFIPWKEDAQFVQFGNGNEFVVRYPWQDRGEDPYWVEWYGGRDGDRYFLNRLQLWDDTPSTYQVLVKHGEAGFGRWLTPRFLRRCEERLGVQTVRWGNIYAAPIPCFEEMRKILRLTHGIQISLKPCSRLELYDPFWDCQFSGLLNRSPKLLNGEVCYFGNGTMYKEGKQLFTLLDGVWAILHSPVWTDVTPGF